MNAETVKRWLEGLQLFTAKLFKLPPSPSLWEGENDNEYGGPSWSAAAEANNNSPPCQTLLLVMSNRNGRNSYSPNSFYPQRRLPCAVFYNVNIFNFSQESFSPTFIFAPLLPILLGFLQIQSSGTSPSPFELRPVALVVSVVCSVAYYLTLTANFMFLGFASLLEALMSVFGSLAVATLISLILRLPWWSIFFILLFIGGLFTLLNQLHATYANIRRPHPRTMQPLLPLIV